jgi:hypothetical protein
MRIVSLAAALCVIVAGWPAAAQLALPGAVTPSQEGTVVKAPRASKSVKSAPAAAPAYVPPGVETLIGRPLLLNGANGALQFSGKAAALRIDKLMLVGEVISNPSQQCRIDVGGGAPIETKSLGRPDGLLRFEAEISACPFEFDVLDGAALVPLQLRACVFANADCQASPSGLWGPAGAGLAADAKTTEKARAHAEAAMVGNYRTLDGRLEDRTKADDLAREQARFSSDREETCHNYLRESQHGFCATRLTEARAAFLKARLDELPAVAAEKKEPPKRRKRKQST